MPGGGDLPGGRLAGQVAAVREDQLRLRRGSGRREQSHRRIRDRAQRPESTPGITLAKAGTGRSSSTNRGGSRHATGSMERQARTSVRAHQGVGEEAGPLDEARQGDRGGDREQAAIGVWRNEEVIRLVGQYPAGTLAT